MNQNPISPDSRVVPPAGYSGTVARCLAKCPLCGKTLQIHCEYAHSESRYTTYIIHTNGYELSESDCPVNKAQIHEHADTPIDAMMAAYREAKRIAQEVRNDDRTV